MAVRVGIDIGGTFTDFALFDEGRQQLFVHKQLTTPHDPSEAVLDGLPVLLGKAGAAMGNVTTLVHGTTLVTNALIERRGAKTAMLVTEGFGDVLDIARERRYDMYDLSIAYAEPLVPRRLRIEVAERIGPKGEVISPLDEEALEQDVERLAGEDVEAVAVCFLNAHANAAHEAVAASVVQRLAPQISVSTSADIFPFEREYERWTTTTMNAFTQPSFARYLDRLERGLADSGFAGRLFIMSSSGGTVSLATARRYPVRMLESGPAAGVLFAAHVAKVFRHDAVLAYDMGGTTAKGALVRAAQPLKRYEVEVARVHEFRAGSGLPARIPVIDLIEIGAGGGSLADIDTRGVIRVGPHSAGARPGPASYSLGGTEPTLTDANLVLGYLSESTFLGGAMPLDPERAEAAISSAVAGPLGVDPLRAAWGIHETINEDVARAFRNHASERGFDYRRAAMVAFGGSGPIHALRVARKLKVPQVIFPAGAGVMSAIGMLASPLAFETVRSDPIALHDLSAGDLDERFARLFKEAVATFDGTGTPMEKVRIRRALDMRYQGQGYDVEVRLPDDVSGEALLDRLGDLFAAAYAAIFSHAFADRPIDILALKLEAIGPEPSMGERIVPAARSEAIARKSPRKAFCPEAGGLVSVPVYDRYGLTPGIVFSGPALIEEPESTVVIGAGDEVAVDARFNLVATTAQAMGLAA
ncbi:MAG: hydantoinase/oxoprolinase family protein [Pseudomonadota bacterium]